MIVVDIVEQSPKAIILALDDYNDLAQILHNAGHGIQLQDEQKQLARLFYNMLLREKEGEK